MNGPPFTATIVNSESNIPIRNGVMHVIRGKMNSFFHFSALFESICLGLLSGAIIPIDGVLNSIQGARYNDENDSLMDLRPFCF